MRARNTYEKRRRCFAWLLLAVFIAAKAVGIGHVHPHSPFVHHDSCADCVAHAKGHVHFALASPEEAPCLACQFHVQTFLPAEKVGSPQACVAQTRAVVQKVARVAIRTPRLFSLRAPPACAAA